MSPVLTPITGAVSRPPASALLTLYSAWASARAEGEETTRRLNAAEAAAMALYPQQPPMPVSVTDPARAAYIHWEAQCGAIDSSFGLPGLHDAFERAFVEAERLAKSILTIAPTDTVEVAAKYAVVLATASDGQGGIDDARPLRVFLAELEELARRSSLGG